MIPGLAERRRFNDLSEQEILALAISSEEDDGRIYRAYAEKLRPDYPASAAVFDGMAAEENEHRRRLIDLHVARFGYVIPLWQGSMPAVRSGLSRTLALNVSGTRPRAWNATRSGSTNLPQGRRGMPRHANCWAIWPPPRQGIATRRQHYRRPIWAMISNPPKNPLLTANSC